MSQAIPQSRGAIQHAHLRAFLLATLRRLGILLDPLEEDAEITALRELPTSAFTDVATLRKSFGITQEQLGQLVSLSTRTISALETGSAKRSPDDERRFVELARLHQECILVMKKEYFAVWLFSPVPYFDGATPAQLIQRGEIDRLWKLIWRLQEGIPLE